VNTRNPQPTTIDRVDPGASYERRRAAMRASWTPEVHEFAAALAEEIDFARRLRAFRETFGLTQRQVADITGEDQGDISRLERRELNPSQDRMNRILGRLRDYADNIAPQSAEQPRLSNRALTTAGHAATYLCAIRDEADRDFRILKLQKLLYYAQGICLALRHRPLFSERIKAWEHGPVIPQIWKDYEGQGNLPRPDDFDLLGVDPEVAAILDRVYAEYGQYAAWALRNMTHLERPWVETARNEEIDRQLMAEFFEERLRIGESRRAPATS
jgi:uncharacterized phage-associated protein